MRNLQLINKNNTQLANKILRTYAIIHLGKKLKANLKINHINDNVLIILNYVLKTKAGK